MGITRLLVTRLCLGTSDFWKYIRRGEVVKDGKDERFEFTWDGNDENDPASGSGWLKLKNKNSIDGEIKFHEGDRSSLVAKRMK